MLRPDPIFFRAFVALILLCTAVAPMAAGDRSSLSGFEILPPLSPDHRGLISHGDRSLKNVALTFDLCQTKGVRSGFDRKIIDILRETGTPATFFLGGLWMRDHIAETRMLAADTRFELGNHSWSHPDFSQIPAEKIAGEVEETQRIMWKILGYQGTLFRLPYGRYSDTALAVIGDRGLYTIQWDVVSGDPDPNVTAGRMTAWVTDQARPGSIIIMHANGRGWHTAEALPVIIRSLRSQGYVLVTVSDLLGLDR